MRVGPLPTQPEIRKPRIFIAEDDRAVLELIVTRLTIAGYETRYGRTGGEALEGIRNSKPAAVILDINMPGIDGFEVLRRMKASPALSAIPVMVLTARNSPTDVRDALAQGARDYLTKPFKDAVLLARLTRLLRPRPSGGNPPSGDDDLLL